MRHSGAASPSNLEDRVAIPGPGFLPVYIRAFSVTTTNSGNCSQDNQNQKQVISEADAGWQRFLEALATRIVREEREKHQARKGE
jgi:hypothetical protein